MLFDGSITRGITKSPSCPTETSRGPIIRGSDNRYARGDNGKFALGKPESKKGVGKTKSRNKDRIGTRMYHWQEKQWKSLENILQQERKSQDV